MGEPVGTGAQRDGDAPQGQGAVTPGWEPAARGAPGGLVPVPLGRGDRKGPAAQHNGPGGRSGCSPSWPALQDTTVQVSSAAGTQGPREREEDEDFPARMSPAPCSSPGWEEGRRHRLRFPTDPSLPKQAAARQDAARCHPPLTGCRPHGPHAAPSWTSSSGSPAQAAPRGALLPAVTLGELQLVQDVRERRRQRACGAACQSRAEDEQESRTHGQGRGRPALAAREKEPRWEQQPRHATGQQGIKIGKKKKANKL